MASIRPRDPSGPDPGIVGGYATTASKRALKVTCHAMERAFQDLATDPGSSAGVDPGGELSQDVGLVIAYFQRREYFDIEAAKYAVLAQVGHTVIVAFHGSIKGLPPGVTAVSLTDGDAERESWVLTLVRGAFAAAVSARDIQEWSAGEATLEASRMFMSWTTLRRDLALEEATTRLEYLAARLPPQVLARAREHLDASTAVPLSPGEERLARVADHLIRSVGAGYQRASCLRLELESTQSLAERDQLTGLHNRHYLQRYLGSGGRPADLMALLIDADDLKQVNDKHGHEAGDALLRCVATTLRTNSRPGDVLIRWGGDEFLVLIPHLDTAAGLRHGHRLAAAIAAGRLDPPWQNLELSASIGVSPIRDTALPMAGLDAALRHAKATHKGGAAVEPTGEAASAFLAPDR